MLQRSPIVRTALLGNPRLRDFIYMDFDVISTVFQHIIDYVHGDIVPIGPGGVVGCFSREAVQWIERMFRLYRAALKFGLEDLADRVIDEIQSHELRCNGSLPVLRIRDVYLRSIPGSKLRLYCAASLYQSGITMKDGAIGTSRAKEFKAVMKRWYTSVTTDIKTIKKLFKGAK